MAKVLARRARQLIELLVGDAKEVESLTGVYSGELPDEELDDAIANLDESRMKLANYIQRLQAKLERAEYWLKQR
jgi:hypothetical protein